MHLPLWARKPKHKKKVIPTSKGWVVESTGEVLVSHKNLDTKLVELFSETHELLSIEKELTNDVVSDHDENVIKVHLDDNNIQDDNGKESSNEEQNQSDDTEIEASSTAEHTETNDEEKTESSSDVVEETNDKKEESTEKPKKKRGRPPKKK